MKQYRQAWCVLAATASLIVLAACGDEPSPAAEAPDYVVLLDDDSDPDQVLGKPGTYALTARGATTPPLAVLDVRAGYSNFGFFALVLPRGDGPTGRDFRGLRGAFAFRGRSGWPQRFLSAA